jgi:multiple sugar transport system substrate-binding protein
MIFDPKSTKAGVAGPIFDIMSNYFVPTLNGEMDPSEAVKSIKEELNGM